MPSEIMRYAAGRAKFKLTGLSIEKFINKARSGDIILLDIKRNKYSEVTFEVNRCDMEKVMKIAEELGLKTELLSEFGILYYLQWFLQHRSFALGMLICVLLIYLSTSFVWTVEITGNKDIPTEQLNSVVRELGVKPGVLKSTLNHDKFVIELLKREKRLTWAELDISGVKARISVVEGEKPPEVVDYSIPCNIVAERDGFLVKLLALNGEKVIEEGNAVKKGQVLVSGIVSSELSGTRYVHALGQAWAHTYYTGEAETDINDYLYKETGNYVVKYELLVNGVDIPLYRGEDLGFENYSATAEDVIPTGYDMYIPLKLRRVKYSELEEMNFDDAMKAAKQESERLAYEKAREEVPSEGKILQRTVESNMNFHGKMHSKVVLEVLEDIAVEEKLLISEEDEFGK